MTAASLLGGFARRAGVAACAALWAFGPSVAAEDTTPYFCERFAWGGPLEHGAAGPDGSVCVAYRTVPTDLPGQIDPPDPALRVQAFVTVIEPDGRVRWTRFLPQSEVRDVRVAPDGAIWLATYAERDAATNTEAAFVTKVGADGTVLATVRLDGSGDEQPNRLALEPNGDVIVVGTTTSPDFPVVNALQPEFGGKADGFVARIRGDGSAIVWSSYIGGADYDDANAVAVDANGDLLVTTRAKPWAESYDLTRSADRVRDVRSVALVRISGDGVPISTLQLPSGPFGGAFDVAVASDGRILVGGVIGFHDGVPTEGYVLPVDPATSALGVGWREADREVHRISVGPGGEVLVGTDRNATHRFTEIRTGGGFVLLTPDLATVLRCVDREENWGVLDVAFAPDGALCISTINASAAVAFHEATKTFVGDEPFVGRLPASGARAPSSVRVKRVTTDEATLTWTNDGDAVVGFDVEADTSIADTYWPQRAIRRVGGARANAHAVRVRGLRPGATNRLRLVANFASGVRTAVAAPVVRTPPARVRRVEVDTDRFPGNYVEWDGGRNGDRTHFEVERSVGFAPFEPVRGYSRSVSSFYRGTYYDPDVSRDDGFIIYRVRAVTVEPRVVTSWTYSGWVLAR